ncbi:(Fe-S)-binding protein [Planctomycetota bacterium]
MSAAQPMLEITDLILEVGGEDLQVCMQCGTCTGVCPWSAITGFSPRMVLRLASLGLDGYEEEDIWRCVTCNACVARCPRGIDIVDVMRAARSVLLESGSIPASYRAPLASLRSSGNPWSGDRSERHAWAEGLQLPRFDASCDYLYFTCCTQAYDPRNRRAAKALVSVLREVGISFGILDRGECCCGEQARKVGAEEVYQELRSSNVELLRQEDARRVIVSSPHCLQVLGSDYGAEIQLDTQHYTQVLAGRLDGGELAPTVPVELKVTYHDPCYLGRHAGEYERPRDLLKALPGLQLVEMDRSRETSLCCGGGGGGLWTEVPQEQRFAVHRIREAQATGASVIATACPYCTSMFEDAVKVLELEETMAVMDVAELVARSLGLEPSCLPTHVIGSEELRTRL